LHGGVEGGFHRGIVAPARAHRDCVCSCMLAK
jgi:hypothetical protein